jgi:DNA helicase-2/ATP-dependent DNA helicase PcrA
MAVLARTNAQLVPMLRALTDAGVPAWSPAPQEAPDVDPPGEPEFPGATDSSGPEQAVTLCSFHRAKGLEWAAVWVTGLEAGLVPIGRAASPVQEQEERRLLYVALTRAATELHCSWARLRTLGGRPVPRAPSPWLELLAAGGACDAGPDEDEEEEGPAAARARWRHRLRDQRRQLAGAPGRGAVPRLPEGFPDPDLEVIGALRAWRAEAARAAGVPAYVVLHDVTLAALASLRPSCTEELLTVPGLGPVKAGRYGPVLLSLVADRAAAG